MHCGGARMPSRRIALTTEAPGLGQVALLWKRLRLFGIYGVHIVRIGQLFQLACPVCRNEWRPFRSRPAYLLERLLHEARIDRGLKIIRLQGRLYALLLIEPVEDRLVGIAPELCQWID